jgi:hypothetical protein
VFFRACNGFVQAYFLEKGHFISNLCSRQTAIKPTDYFQSVNPITKKNKGNKFIYRKLPDEKAQHKKST